MLETLFVKTIVFVLIVAILNVIRETTIFTQCYRKAEEYKLDDKRLFGLWGSISYILTIIFTGI